MGFWRSQFNRKKFCDWFNSPVTWGETWTVFILPVLVIQLVRHC
jgi:hypothetical protein